MKRIYLFFSKKILFKKLFIIISIFTPMFLLIDSIIVKELLDTKELFDGSGLKDFLKSIIGALIWVPYIIYSKRVKRTFVN